MNDNRNCALTGICRGFPKVWHRDTAASNHTSETLTAFADTQDVGSGMHYSFLTLGAHAQRGFQYSFCHSVRPSVCPSVTTFSATTRNKAAKKRYQRVQCHTGLILKRVVFVKVLRSKVMA